MPTDGPTDVQGQANSRFSKFCEIANHGHRHQTSPKNCI